MKTREHIGHNKTNIIEIQPNRGESRLIRKIKRNYLNIIELEKEKLKKLNDKEEFKNKLKDRKK